MRKSNFPRACYLGLMLAGATLAHGQVPKSLPKISPTDAAKASAEAARILERAKANNVSSAARLAEAAPQVKRMDSAVQRAKDSKSGQPSFAEQARAAESQKRLQAAMSRVSPEGKALLAQNSNAAPALRAPSDSLATPPSPTAAKGATKESPLSSDAPGPKPQPLKATPLDAPGKPPVPTVITAGSSFFDSREGFGVFVDDVVLDHPEFHLTSDELEVYMNKEEKPEEKKEDPNAPKPSNGPTAGELAQQNAAEDKSKGLAPSERKTEGNIKKAIAKGRRVVINKLSPDGTPQTGIGREAEYDGASGNMILRGEPQIQKGNHLQVAIDPTTYFIIQPDGKFYHAGGRAQTRIIQQNEKKAPPAPGAPTVPGPPAPVIGNKTQGGQQ